MDDIKNYTFDFEKETKALKESVGHRLDDVFYAEVSVSPPQEEGGTPRIALLYDEEDLGDFPTMLPLIASIYQENPERSSSRHILERKKDEETLITREIVAMRATENYSLGPDMADMMRLWVLYHETGHILIPNHREDGMAMLRNENDADAYAALRMLQRFGQKAVPLLSMVSWTRAFNTAIGDKVHFTSATLDKIIADSKGGAFKNLDAAATITCAKNYAENWTPTFAMMKKAIADVVQGSSLSLTDLAETSLSSPSNFAFYIGAKIFHPFLKPQGAEIQGEPCAISSDLRRDAANTIRARTGNMALHDVFNRRNAPLGAQPTLAAATKVSLPPRQKQLIYNV